MTLDEAIEERLKVIKVQEKLYEESYSDESKEIIKSATDNDRQLVEWLMELKELRNSVGAVKLSNMKEALELIRAYKAENAALISECDRLIKEKGELLSKVSGGDVLRICQLENQLQAELDNSHCLEIELTEAKRLLKAAVEDFSFVSKNFISNIDSFCSMYNHMAGCVKDCPMNGLDDYGRCKWRYTDEALKLIGGETDEKP